MKNLATIAMIAALSVPSLALAGSPTAVAPVEVIVDDEPAGLSGGSSATAAIIALAAILLIAAADDSSSGT